MKYIEATVNCKGISGLLTGGEGGRREVFWANPRSHKGANPRSLPRRGRERGGGGGEGEGEGAAAYLGGGGPNREI